MTSVWLEGMFSTDDETFYLVLSNMSPYGRGLIEIPLTDTEWSSWSLSSCPSSDERKLMAASLVSSPSGTVSNAMEPAWMPRYGGEEDGAEEESAGVWCFGMRLSN